MPCRFPIPHASCFGIAPRIERAGLKMPATWDDLFAAGPVFKQKFGDKAFAIDGELYDMILLSQTYIMQKYGTPYVHPVQPKVAMTEAAALEWVQTYKKLTANNVAVPLPLRASLGGAEKPTEQQQRLGEWKLGRQLHVGQHDRPARQHIEQSTRSSMWATS